MYRHELLQKFYDEFGYLPDEEELGLYEDEFNHKNYSEQQIYNGQDTQRKHNTHSEPQNELLEELGQLFHDVSKSAKSSLKGARDKVITDERVEEFNNMLIAFLLKSALFFVLKNSYEKGYNFNDL